jgi:hypothetical protein
MLELIIYGLMWLAAMLLVAFWFAYSDEFSSPQEKGSFDLINDAPSNDSPMIETEMGNPQFRGKVGSKENIAAASSLQTKSRFAGPDAIYSGGFQGDHGQEEAFRG